MSHRRDTRNLTYFFQVLLGGHRVWWRHGLMMEVERGWGFSSLALACQLVGRMPLRSTGSHF